VSNAFAVTHSTVKELVFTVNPTATVDNGVAITPSVKAEIRDQYENLVNDGAESTAAVSLAINNGGTLSGNSVSAVSGVATFTALAVTSTGTGYILTASSGSWTQGTSSSFNVTGHVISSVTCFCSGPSNTDCMKTVATPNGDAGTKVVIAGTGFGAAQGTVTFNALQARKRRHHSMAGDGPILVLSVWFLQSAIATQI